MTRIPKRASKKPDRTPKAYSATFAEHITELRKRLVWVALVATAASGLAFQYHDVLLAVITAPLDEQKLVYLTPAGGFSFIFQIALYGGLLVAAPFTLYQLYGFIKPALPEAAQRSTPRVVIAGSSLLLAGVAYGYFVAVPAALDFLTGFAGPEIAPTLTADSYLSFFMAYIGGLAALSLLPLGLMFWHWAKPLTPSGLMKSERWVIILAFIAAAIVTPTPDAANQAMIAIPVIGLYQIGVVAVIISIHKNRRNNADKQFDNHRPATTAHSGVKPAPLPAPVAVLAQPPTNQLPRRQATPRSLDGFVRTHTVRRASGQTIRQNPGAPVRAGNLVSG